VTFLEYVIKNSFSVRNTSSREKIFSDAVCPLEVSIKLLPSAVINDSAMAKSIARPKAGSTRIFHSNMDN